MQTKRLRPVDSTLKPIDDLNSRKDSLTISLDEAVKEYDKKSNELHDMKISMDDVNTKIQSYMNDGVNEQYLELEKLEKERDLFQIELDKLKIEVRTKLDKIEKLGDLTWDEDCDHCMSNPFTLDAIETKKNLNKDKVLAQEYVTKKQLMEDEINKKFKVRAYKKDLDELKGQYLHFQTDSQFLESGVELLQEKQKRINNNLNIVLSDIEKSKRQEKDVLFNTEIENELEKLQNQSDDLDYQMDMLAKKSTTLHGEIQVLKTKEKQINDNIDKVEKLEGDHQAYQFLLEAIKRDGVPYDLISKSLPTIEGAVNDILAQIVDFNIVFNMDGKQIDTHIVYDDDRVWPLELSSGMERFVSSLAIRVGLMNVSNLPRSNFLAIDEGWGTMDSENLNSVAQLFQYLKTQFQFSFVVSHIESMRDFVDTLLEIKKVSGSSSVRFSRD